jgi:asparagine synthase (glutamine-hydrolysing)
MCGIVGIAGYRDDQLVKRMTETILHRGPDDHGYFFHNDLSVGMRRLSIIDLKTGHQPMLSEKKDVIVVFNGEVYNFQLIRKDLEKSGHQFKTNSDTEVILRGYITWGLEIIDKLIGMFVIAIADFRHHPKLLIIRDRFGVKPVYYHFDNGRLTFASEMKAILKSTRIQKKINPHAIDQYLKLRYVPGHECLFRGIYKIPAGSYLKFAKSRIEVNRYWKVAFPEEKQKLTLYEAVERLGWFLRNSIKHRLVSDVPVGAFLSGGVDSSVIVALMRESNVGELNTFSVGFGSDKDETSYAASTAKLFETRHHEILCTDEDFGLIDNIAWHLDEPIGDAIVLPMYLLAREARKHVKVILAGEGADEVFGGYLFHKALSVIAWYKKHFPKILRKLNQKVFSTMPHQLINLLFEYPAELGNEGKKKIQCFLEETEYKSIEKQFRSLISLYTDDELQQYYHGDFKHLLSKEKPYITENDIKALANPIDAILSIQFRDWLPDDILMKLDKMTMANSLEGREPFLDHALVSFANSLPVKYKINGWRDKYLLRKFAMELLPKTVAFRKKQPFYIPVEKYFQKPTFKRLFDQFHAENFLREIFSKTYLESLNLSNTSLLSSKQIFSLIMLNRWFKLYSSGI